MLIGYDLQDHDRLTGETVNESSNFLTGLKLISVTQYDPQTDKDLLKTNDRKQVAKKRLTIEQIRRAMAL